ncbi:hypothetical protein CR513_09605, partial [Mucuna pruriens]
MKTRAARKYNRKVIPRNFKTGDLVLKRITLSTDKNKLTPYWEGPFRIIEEVGQGAYLLENLEKKKLPRTWNAASLRMYYKLKRKVEVAFTLGNYDDMVLCDVVPMESCPRRSKQNEIKENKRERTRDKKTLKKKREKKMRKVLLAKREPLYAFPTMLLHAFSSSFVISLPTRMTYLLKVIKDMFPEDIPSGLPPLRGIKHHIDLSIGATLPNKVAYMMNLEEGKEIQNPVEKYLIPRLDDLLDKLHDSQMLFKIDLKNGLSYKGKGGGRMETNF